MTSVDGKTHEPGCVYTVLSAEDLITISNLDLSLLESTVKSFKVTDTFSNYVNNLVLKLIKAFDMKEDLSDYLYTAIRLSEWLEDNDGKSAIYKMNRLQAIKRTRCLNKEEKMCLMEIKQSYKDDYNILCGISILLENKSDFEYYIDLMTEEERNHFSTFPIYTLANRFK